MVFALSPDFRAMSTKLKPRAEPGFGASSLVRKAGHRRGPVDERMLSKERITADLLRDWKNPRREENKRVVPSRSWLVLEFAPTLLGASRLCKLMEVANPGDRVSAILVLSSAWNE